MHGIETIKKINELTEQNANAAETLEKATLQAAENEKAFNLDNVLDEMRKANATRNDEAIKAAREMDREVEIATKEYLRRMPVKDLIELVRNKERTNIYEIVLCEALESVTQSQEAVMDNIAK